MPTHLIAEKPMTSDIEKNLHKILQCTEKSSERVYFAARDLVEQIGKSGKRKKDRQSAIEALQKIALEAYSPLHSFAANSLANLLTPADTDCLPFLRTGLKYEDIAYGCVCGLLKVIGEEAYKDIVELILDSKRSLDIRSSALKVICHHSGQRFDEGLPLFMDMKVADLPIDEVRAWADAGFPAYVAPKIEVPESGLKKLGIELSEDYLKFLRQYAKSVTYEYDGCSWELTTGANLLAKVDVDGKSVPSVQQLKRYAAVLKKSMKADTTEDHKGKPYPLDRLAAGIAIGTDDTGDVLYLDPADKLSVWIFHHDGGDVERASKTFTAWLRKAERESH